MIYESELKVLELLWQYGEISASKLYKMLEEKTGWSKTTSYTIIKRCIDKGLISKTEPNYLCRANVTKREAQQEGISELLKKFFNNSYSEFLKSFIDNEILSEDDISELKDIVKKLK